MFHLKDKNPTALAERQLGILWARLNGRKKRARQGVNFHGRSGTGLLHAKNQPTNIKFRLYGKSPLSLASSGPGSGSAGIEEGHWVVVLEDDRNYSL